MANQKTTQFPYAATLTGAEIVGVVQSGGDVQTTLTSIRGLLVQHTIHR